MTENNRLLFICPMMTHPRIIKRVIAARQAGFDVTVVSYEREYYPENQFPSDVRLISLGKIKNGRYLRRSLRMIAARRIVRRVSREILPAAIYSFGDDNLILAIASKSRNSAIVHELGDLRVSKSKWSMPHRAFEAGRRWLYSFVDYLVLISQGFATHLDSFINTKTSVVVIENKLAKELIDLADRKPTIGNIGPIQIGLIGFLRYRTISALFEIVSENPDRFCLNIWGDGPLREEAEKVALKCSNINFHGSFKNPDQIPSIYEKTDISFVVYDSSDLNVRLALPNKLYESAFFGVPILVANGTELFRRSTELGLGLGVEPFSIESLEQALFSLSRSDLASTQLKIIEEIDTSELLDDGAKFFLQLKSDTQESNSAIEENH